MTMGVSSHHNSWRHLWKLSTFRGCRSLWILHSMICTLNSPLQAYHFLGSLLTRRWSSESCTFLVATCKPLRKLLAHGSFWSLFLMLSWLLPPCCHASQSQKYLCTLLTGLLSCACLLLMASWIAEAVFHVIFIHTLAFRRHSTDTLKEMNLWIKRLCSVFSGSENTHKRDMRTLF